MEHITELSYTVDKLRPCQAVQAYFSVFFFLMEYTCTLLCIELTVQFEPYNNLQISMHVNALYMYRVSYNIWDSFRENVLCFMTL